MFVTSLRVARHCILIGVAIGRIGSDLASMRAIRESTLYVCLGVVGERVPTLATVTVLRRLLTVRLRATISFVASTIIKKKIIRNLVNVVSCRDKAQL